MFWRYAKTNGADVPRYWLDVETGKTWSSDTGENAAVRSGMIEVLSGALREWLPEGITARLLDNGVIPEAPRLDEDGEITNLAALGGYGPFLQVACRRNAEGQPTFPDTFGGGIGIERLLWALLRGPHVGPIDDVTYFGKNPDSAELFLF